uniref:Uncharacterized protein n=1 Tax=Oryza punctata TaxID=4537 RepID=A0A0E0JE91_ORYPU
MAAEAWRARFRERVVEAEKRWEPVRVSLATALTHVTSPMLASDEEEAAAARTRIQLAMGELGNASRDLALAMSVMKAAELLALHGGSVNPSALVGGISHLGAQYLAERDAGTKLLEAYKAAREAYVSVDWCRSHLDAILLLLDHPSLPGIDDSIEEERAAADGHLQAAKGSAELGTEKAVGAREDAWRERFRDRVVEAAQCWERLCVSLSTALTHVTSPMLATDEEEAAAARTRIQLAMGELGDASRDLASAMSLMKVAELLALHGGSVNPSTRLGGIGLLGDQYLAERNAGTKLREAGKEAREAYVSVDWCRSNLDAILLLLDHPRLPGVDGMIEEELFVADDNLQGAIGNAKLGNERVAGARQDVSGAN